MSLLCHYYVENILEVHRGSMHILAVLGVSIEGIICVHRVCVDPRPFNVLSYY